jgi:hypothetical protein
VRIPSLQLTKRVCSIGKVGAKRTGHGTLDVARGDGGTSLVKGGGASGAIVVDIDDGNLCHAKLVKNTLTSSTVTINITNSGKFNGIIINASIVQGLDRGLQCKF